MQEERINMEGLKSGTYLSILSIDGKNVFRSKIIKGSTQ
jgi:hypothetical protein